MKPARGSGFVLLLIGLAIGLTSSSVVGLLTALPGLLISIPCTIWLVVVLRQPRPPDLGSQVAAREAELRQSQHQRQDVSRQLAERLAPFGCTTWHEFSQKLSEYKECLKQQLKAATRHEALLGDRTLEALIEERKTASRQRRDAEDALAAPEMQKAAETTPLEYQELKREMERLGTELAEKERDRDEYRIRGEIVDYTVEDIHRLEEQKAAAERSLAHLEEQLAVCQLTREVMEEAKEQTMRSARAELQPSIGAYLGRITQGRYTRVEADDDLTLRVFSQEKGGWITSESGELSRGAVDQLCLATRLALLDHLYGDAKPPPAAG